MKPRSRTNPPPEIITTRDALSWFNNNNDPLKIIYSDLHKTKMEQLKNGVIGHGIAISDIKDSGEIAEAIYKIRNNIIHGSWQINGGIRESGRDSLINVAAQILHKWLTLAYLKGILSGRSSQPRAVHR